MPSSCAVSARTTKWPWLELQISPWPSASKRAHAALRLDIGLMHGRGLERHFDDLVGRRETGLHIAELELDPLRDIGGLAGAGSIPRVIRSGNSSGASGFIASSTSMTCGSTS